MGPGLVKILPPIPTIGVKLKEQEWAKVIIFLKLGFWEI